MGIVIALVLGTAFIYFIAKRMLNQHDDNFDTVPTPVPTTPVDPSPVIEQPGEVQPTLPREDTPVEANVQLQSVDVVDTTPAAPKPTRKRTKKTAK